MGEHGKENGQPVSHNVKLVLNVVGIYPDGMSPYKVYLTDDMRSPWVMLGDEQPIEALKRLCADHFYGDAESILSTLSLIDVRKNADRVIIYYSVCVDNRFSIRNGRMVHTESLNSDILRKIMATIDHSVRFGA